MTKDEQRKFLRAQSKYILSRALKAVDTGLPKEWQGLELRWLLGSWHVRAEDYLEHPLFDDRAEEFQSYMEEHNL